MNQSTKLQQYCQNTIVEFESTDQSTGDFSCIEEQQSQINRLKEYLVKPFQENINFYDYAKYKKPKLPLARTLWVVADDGEGKRICYSEETKQFHLAKYNPKDPSKCSSTVGVYSNFVTVLRNFV